MAAVRVSFGFSVMLAWLAPYAFACHVDSALCVVEIGIRDGCAIGERDAYATGQCHVWTGGPIGLYRRAFKLERQGEFAVKRPCVDEFF